MIVIPQHPEIIAKQEIVIDAKKHFWKNDFNSLINRSMFNEKIKFKIFRYLADDTFKLVIELPKVHFKSNYFAYPSVNINNDKVANYNYSYEPFRSYIKKEWNQDFTFDKFHMNMIKFNNINKIIVGYDQVLWNEFQKIISSKYSYSLRKKSISSLLTTNFQTVIHLKIPKKITLIPNILVMHFKLNDKNMLIDEHISNFEKQYEHIYLKLNKPNWKNKNQSLIDVYAYDETNNSNFLNDFNDEVSGILKSTSVPSGLKTQFKYLYDKNKIYQSKDNFKAKYVGSINAIETTYFDYKKNDVAKGFGKETTYGDMIPYNFKGIYRWSIKLNLNNAINNLIINATTNIKKPFLDVNDGSVILKVNEENNHYAKLDKSLNFEDIKIIKDNELSLIAIFRLSENNEK